MVARFRATSGLYALIIGINEYQGARFSNLAGAVSDADNIKAWVEKDFEVPPERIRNLRDKQATRDEIIAELENLANNPAIQPNDPILIFFAGHGSQAPPPKQWHWDAPEIEMIVPSDYGVELGPKRTVQGIPDRTLGLMMSVISEEKGDNITVILDCCHSGSGTRSSGDSRVRGLYLDEPVEEGLDDALFAKYRGTSRGMEVSERFRHAGLRSHVLLAACAPGEKAWEEKSAGNFTRVFLKALVGVSASEITYEELLSRMDDLTTQTPQCEGFFKTRYMFDKKAPNTKAVYQATAANKRLTIDAGAINGIQKGALVGLWKSRSDLQKEPYARGTVTTVRSFDSVINTFFPNPKSQSSFVCQVLGNPPPSLAIYIPDDVERLECFKELFNEENVAGNVTKGGFQLPVFNRVHNRELATIGLTCVSEDKKTWIGFETLSPEESQQMIRHVIEPTAVELSRAIDHLNSYYRHKGRINSNPPVIGPKDKQVPFASKFTLELFPVMRADEDFPDGGRRVVPAGPNLLVQNAGLRLTIWESNKNDDYGLLLHNHTDFDVFPYLFYFNSSRFSIRCIYQPEATTKSSGIHIPIPPLKARGTLKIGYEASAVAAQSLDITHPDDDIELGYLRLYLSTRWVDLKTMELGPISAIARDMMPKAVSGGPDPIWDCITYPVVLRRGKEEGMDAGSAGSRGDAKEEDKEPTMMIGIIGSKGSGKDLFLQELFKSLSGNPNSEPSFENAYLKEYRIELPGEEPFALVDLPAFTSHDDRVDLHVSMLKATMAYLASEYQRGRHFHAVIWCHNIWLNFMGVDNRNLNFVKDLCGSSMFDHVLALTTGWDKGAEVGLNKAAGKISVAGVASPLEKYRKKEEALKTGVDLCKDLVDQGASFERFGLFKNSDAKAMHGDTSAIKNPQEILRSLLSNDPRPLQCQEDAVRTRILSKTGPGRRLRSGLIQAIKKTQEANKLREVELKNLRNDHPTWFEIQGEKKDAEMDIVRWEKTLEQIGMVNSALA